MQLPNYPLFELCLGCGGQRVGFRKRKYIDFIIKQMKGGRKCQWEEGGRISPWDNDDDALQALSYFSELPERKKSTNLPHLSRRKVCSNLQQHPNLRTLQRESIRKSLKEINIKFHCHQGPPRGERQEHGRNSDGAILQQISIKNFIVGGGEGTKERKRKRQSTYILKQKFATIRRSMVLMSENKENTAKSLRYDF